MLASPHSLAGFTNSDTAAIRQRGATEKKKHWQPWARTGQGRGNVMVECNREADPASLEL